MRTGERLIQAGAACWILLLFIPFTSHTAALRPVLKNHALLEQNCAWGLDARQTGLVLAELRGTRQVAACLMGLYS